MRPLLLLALLLCSQGSRLGAGEKEGHGGDPLVSDFFKRAQFVLNEMRRNVPIERELIDAFAAAFRNLRVDITDAPLPSVGRVLPDPEHPGKSFVLLDRKKYFDCMEKKTLFDLNSFVAHEVFETVNLDLSPDYKISQKLRFSEARYLQWYAQYLYPTTSPNPADRFGAFAYSFETGSWGISWNRATPSEAEAHAQALCKGADCQSLLWVKNGCAAVAQSSLTTTVIGFAWSGSRSEAERTALNQCQSYGHLCRSLNSVCTDYAKP